MGSFTAQLLVGGSHRNHGGTTAENMLFLSENSRPALVVEGEKDLEQKVWIPTLEKAIEDAMLMVSAYILKDSKVEDKLKNYVDLSSADHVEFYEVFTEEQREELYALNREVLKDYGGLKVVFTILDGSLLRGQLSNLKNYEIDMEVCLSVYSRFYSEWRGEVVINGSLDVR